MIPRLWLCLMCVLALPLFSAPACGSEDRPEATAFAAETPPHVSASPSTHPLVGKRQSLEVSKGDAPPQPSIDTQLEWSTYLGGPGDDGAWVSVALDNSGGVIVAGDAGPGLPTTAGAYDPSYGGNIDGFVARFDPTQSGEAQLVWCTYLGGALEDAVMDLVLVGGDEDAVIVVGVTQSPDFPTTLGAYDRTHNGSRDAFVARLGANGSVLSYSTFLGKASPDWACAIALDASQAVTVAGYTESIGFPTTPGAHDTSYNGNRDAFVARLDPTLSALVYSTFLGGGSTEGLDNFFANIRTMDLAVDESGAATVVGYTTSQDFPTTPGAYQTLFGGTSDAFVTRLGATGAALETSTFLGGQGDEGALSVALSPTGDTVTGGFVFSSNFATTPGAYDRSYNGSQDGFVTSLDRTGSELSYSTYLGGSGFDGVGAVAFDVLGDLIVTGWGGSQGFPTTLDAYDPTFNGGAADVVLLRVRPAGNGANDLVYGTFLGGIGDDYGLAFALDEPFEVTLAGAAGTMFPTTPGAFDETHNGGGWDVFAARLGSIGTTAVAGPPGTSLPQRPRLGAPYPNPCHGPVSFAIEVAEQASVRVGVYDVSGRLVVQLMDRCLDPGSYDVSWKAQTVTGHVPPGTYFLRLDTAGGRESRKIVIEP